MPARDASTGEQKALLIGLVLAHAGLVAEMTGIAPLLLLDEVVAHLDPGRRAALFDELAKLGAQVWMTGADPAAFADIGASGEIFEVEDGADRRAAPEMRVAAETFENRDFVRIALFAARIGRFDALKKRRKTSSIQ